MLLSVPTAAANPKAEVEEVVSTAGLDTTRLVLSARRCLFQLMQKTKPGAEPGAYTKPVWDKFLEANAKQFAKLRVKPLSCAAKYVKTATFCLPSLDGMLHIPLGCTGQFQALVLADDQLTLGFDPPAEPGTADYARQAILKELQRLNVEADVVIHGLFDIKDGRCAERCDISVFCKNVLPAAQLEQIADAVYLVARESMMQAGMQRVLITNRPEMWKQKAERPTPQRQQVGSGQTAD
jgi:hypothetical protein